MTFIFIFYNFCNLKILYSFNCYTLEYCQDKASLSLDKTWRKNPVYSNIFGPSHFLNISILKGSNYWCF
jgi:hypothetical protein